jgi:opacity protein-like surface antigen
MTRRTIGVLRPYRHLRAARPTSGDSCPESELMTTRYVASLTGLITLALPIICLAADTDQTRFYLAIRLGGALFTTTQPVKDVEFERFADSPLISGSVGLNLGKHWGVEVAGDGHETNFRVPGAGKIGEYAIWTIIPQVRLRYPLLANRLTPYLVGGVGVGFTEFNDTTPSGEGFHVNTTYSSVVGSLGGGLEYFVVHNIALGVEAKYLFFRDVELRVNGLGGKANLDQVLLSGGLRIFFP